MNKQTDTERGAIPNNSPLQLDLGLNLENCFYLMMIIIISSLRNSETSSQTGKPGTNVINIVIVVDQIGRPDIHMALVETISAASGFGHGKTRLSSRLSCSLISYKTK